MTYILKGDIRWGFERLKRGKRQPVPLSELILYQVIVETFLDPHSV